MDKAALKDKEILWDIGNAVKTQIWIAVSVYVLIAIIKRQLKFS